MQKVYDSEKFDELAIPDKKMTRSKKAQFMEGLAEMKRFGVVP